MRPEQPATDVFLDADTLGAAEPISSRMLTLRGAELPQTDAAGEDKSRYVRLAELAQAGTAKPALKTVAAPRVTRAPSKKKATADSNTAQVIVHRGDQVEVVKVQN